MEKSTDNSKIQGFQSKKYDATIRGKSCLSIPRPLINLSESLSASEFKAAIKLWNWFQSPEVKGLRFITSRHHLAEMASVGHDTARTTLQFLKRAGAIQEVATSFGVSTYEWNSDWLEGGVAENQAGVAYNIAGRCLFFSRPLPKNQAASYICTLFIPSFIPSYTAISGHRPADAAPVALRAPYGELKVALRAGLPKETIRDALRAGLPFEKVAATMAAIISLWDHAGAGGKYSLVEITLVLKANMVNLYSKDNPGGYLRTMMEDGAANRARKYFKDYPEQDRDLIDHLYSLYQLEQGERNDGKEV